jgi:AcrR family transcriptional regulator
MKVHSFLADMNAASTTKDKVERAALKLFVEQGIAETSIKEIAREAGVSQGAMYNHYVSKDDLAKELFLRGFSDIGEELRRVARSGALIGEKLRSMISYVFQRFDEDWLAVSYVFLSRHLYLRRVTSQQGNPYLAFRSVIANAIAHREIPKQNPDLAASMVTGVIIQVIDTKILGRISGRLSRLSNATADACARLLGAK